MNQRYEPFAVAFYNAIAEKDAKSWEDIPPEAQRILIIMDYETLIAPAVCEFMENGASRDKAAIRFGIHPSRARRIAQRSGILPRNKRSK